MKKIRRAAGTAIFSGWTIAIFGALTVVFDITNLPILAFGIRMCVIAHFEFRGAARLRRLDVEAPKHLATNQCVFGGMIVAYSAWMLYTKLNGPPSDFDREMLQSLPELAGALRMSYLAIYVGLIVGGVLGCGLTAMYYYSRRKFVETYLTQTPSWIVEMQQNGSAI